MKVRVCISLVAVVSAFGAVLTSCGGNDDEENQTALTIHVATTGGSRTFELRCDPPGGTAPNPQQLCTSLDAHAMDILSRTEQVSFGPRDISISGTYRGQLIEHDAGPFPIGWWNALIPAAIATPNAVPVPREPRTFRLQASRASSRPVGVVAWPSTLAQAGDIVVCIVDGKRFRNTVPEEGMGMAQIADPPEVGVAVTFSVSNDGGVVTAQCEAEG